MRRTPASFLFSLLCALPALAVTLDCPQEVARAAAPPRIYFTMTRLYGNGTFDAVTADLPRLRAMGVNTVWISPVHEQVPFEKADFGTNNHGYWPKSHDSIDPKLGGEEGLRRLVADARASGIQVCLDIVPNHFGYGDEFVVGGRKVDRRNTAYFRRRDDAAPLIQPRERELWDELDREKDPQVLLARQRELSAYPLFALPGLEHGNPEVRKYLFESYRKFIDLGVDMFRLDAAKHMSLPFVYEFVEQMSAYGRERGRRIRFILEFSTSNSHTLEVFVRDGVAHVTDGDALLFYDFPLTEELRRLADPTYKLSWLAGFLRHREAQGYALKNVVPFVENHDFQTPLRDPFVARLAYGLAEFVSANPVILHHGGERAGAQTDGRPQIAGVDPAGDIAQETKALAQAMGDYRKVPAAPVRIVHEEDDVLVLERSLGARSFIFVVNKGANEAVVQLPRTGVGASAVRRRWSEGAVGVEDTITGDGLRVTLPGRSFAAFEAESDARGVFELLKAKSPLTKLQGMSEGGATVRRLSEAAAEALAPEVKGTTLLGRELGFKITTPEAFHVLEPQFRTNGYWVLFQPSGLDPLFPGAVPCGHLMIIVNGRVYSRNADGPKAITSVPFDRLEDDPFTAAMLKKSYYVAQFFETDERSVATLADYLDARQREPGRMRYLFRPLSSSRRADDTENCATFTAPWTAERMLAFRPALADVARQLGPMTVAEMPNFQLALNAGSPAYRGSVLVTTSPDAMRVALLRDGMTRDAEGRELLLQGAMKAVDP